MMPAKAPTLPIRSPDRFELGAERVARLQVAFGELLRLAHLRFEEGVLQRQKRPSARKPTLMKASLLSQSPSISR